MYEVCCVARNVLLLPSVQVTPTGRPAATPQLLGQIFHPSIRKEMCYELFLLHPFIRKEMRYELSIHTDRLLGNAGAGGR